MDAEAIAFMNHFGSRLQEVRQESHEEGYDSCTSDRNMELDDNI